MGRRASETLPFGDSSLTLVITPRGSLGGTFFQLLPWIIAVVGVVLAVAATLLTDRLTRRRERAELLAANLDRVAAENQRLYAEQRGIAEMLQHALLPEALPALAGTAAAARYVPGTSGIEIGGDWYDLIVQRDATALLVIGDVAGRGVRAATTMASLRFAVLAYAAESDDPAELLWKLSRFPGAQGSFATVLCARLDVRERRITVASAGHLPPLVVAGGTADYVPLKVGVPIGAGAGEYEDVTVAAPPRATFIAFTDGLVERRGEVIDQGLERLRHIAAASAALALEDLLTTLVAELPVDGGQEDDTAVLAVRWTA
jgi:serine phosphatase RsbU (regulator of sigma subunit)